MKKMHLWLWGVLLVTVLPAVAQKVSKEEKTAQQVKSLAEARALLESRQFEVEILHVYPQGGGDVSRFNPRGKIIVKDSVAEGNLPFFGRAYSLPYGEGGGIEFDAPMKNPQVKTVKKKKKQSVTFSFSVPGKSDTYQITIETMGGDGCSVFLVSNNRTQISYSGKIKALERGESKI